MVKSSSHSAYNLILAMVAWWMPVLESPTNLGQMRKMPKEPPKLTPWHALTLRDPGSVQTWAETLLVCPVSPFFLQCGAASLILKVQNYFGWH